MTTRIARVCAGPLFGWGLAIAACGGSLLPVDVNGWCYAYSDWETDSGWNYAGAGGSSTFTWAWAEASCVGGVDGATLSTKAYGEYAGAFGGIGRDPAHPSTITIGSSLDYPRGTPVTLQIVATRYPYSYWTNERPEFTLRRGDDILLYLSGSQTPATSTHTVAAYAGEVLTPEMASGTPASGGEMVLTVIPEPGPFVLGSIVLALRLHRRSS